MFLFDIDGTFLDLFDYHLSTYQETLRELFNVTALQPDQFTRFFGLPLRGVLEEIFQLAGIPVTEEHIEKAVKAYLQRLKTKLAGVGPETVFPGVFDLLNELEKASFPKAIITGNPRATGEIIVAGTGLGRYFPPSARFYASTSRQETRDALIHRAMEWFNYLFPGERRRVVVVGDTSHDMKAATRTGAWPVAVAYRNRYYTANDLAKSGARFLIKEPVDFPELLFAAINHFSL